MMISRLWGKRAWKFLETFHCNTLLPDIFSRVVMSDRNGSSFRKAHNNEQNRNSLCLPSFLQTKNFAPFHRKTRFPPDFLTATKDSHTHTYNKGQQRHRVARGKGRDKRDAITSGKQSLSRNEAKETTTTASRGRARPAVTDTHT